MSRKKTITINLTGNKKAGFLLMFLGAVIFLPMALDSQSLEVRTYYPYPYASYNNITVTDLLTLGDYDYDERIRVGNIIQGTRNFRGIESNGDLYLQSVWAVNIAGDIQLSVPGRDAVLGRFCRWKPWNGSGTQCAAGLRGGVQKWQPVMLAYRVSTNSYRTYYNTITQNNDRRYQLNNHATRGRVLCCRIEDPNR